MSQQIMISKIVGIKFHTGAREVIESTPSNSLVEFRREPNNKYDKNAVAVYIPSAAGPFMVGHIARSDAGTVAAAIDAGRHVRATKRGYCQLRIDLDSNKARVFISDAERSEASEANKARDDKDLNDDLPIHWQAPHGYGEKTDV